MGIHDLNTHYEPLIPRSMAPYWIVTRVITDYPDEAIAVDLGSDWGPVNVEPMLLRFRDIIPRFATALSGDCDSQPTQW